MTNRETHRLEWDFFGEDSEETANHHLRHVRELLSSLEIEALEAKVECPHAMQATSIIVLPEEHAGEVAARLRPKRVKPPVAPG